MRITSAKFIKGLVGDDPTLDSNLPQVAFIGRSNVGKSSVINTITSQKNLAITSSFPGRTQQINLFLINEKIYFLDLPGYGYAKLGMQAREKILGLINWYLFESIYDQKHVVLIIDANVGPTKDDLAVFNDLANAQKNIIVVANKIDKIKKSEYNKKIAILSQNFKNYPIVPFSSTQKTGLGELTEAILS